MRSALLLAGASAALVASPATGQEATPAAAPRPVRAPAAPGDAAASRVNTGSNPRNAFPSESIGLGPRMGQRYAMSRWSEDWSYLRDPARRKDRFDPLKFIPIAGDADTYLTLSGQERLRLETYGNPGLRKQRMQDAELVRTVIGADLHIGEHLRVFGELASGQQFGRVPDSPNGRNDLVVQALFAEVKGRIAGADAGIIAGRQQFLDGPVPLISVRENNNIQTTLQGVRAYANWPRVRIDLVDLRYVDLGLNGFDEHVSDTMRFRGGIASFVASPEGAKRPFFIDPFFYRNTDDQRRWGGRVGREERNFYGLGMHGALGPASVDWSASYQSGSYDNRPLRAWSVSLDQSVELSPRGWKPTIGLHADMGSGGGAFGSGTLRNADFLFGTNPYLNDSKAFGIINLADVSPTLSFAPARGVTVRTEYNFLRRIRQNEAVYSGTKAAYAGTQLVAGHDIGQQARLRVGWAIDPHITVAGNVEHVFAGPVLRQAGFHDSTFTTAQITFKF
ncbi:MAG: hypothetical protein JWL91_691 [Sphingomonas bacterium]|nr:alginate export family protein [Sphingomonas bacterium]MDB5688815.1 hypothetical protein [Sphingomonas bacterium]